MWPTIYGALAVFTCVSVWRDRELQIVGLTLLAGWGVTNLSNMFFSMAERPAVFTVIEVAISLMASFAWFAGKSRALLVLLAVSVISCAANVSIALIVEPQPPQIALWQLVTNICFAGECLALVIAGVRARGSLRNWFAPSGGSSQFGVAARTKGTDG